MTAESTTPRTSEFPISPILLDRWSPRSFRPDPLTPTQIGSLLEAARWAPSCFNAQPWFIVYGTAGTSTHARLLDLLVASNRVWAGTAPLLLLFFARRNFPATGKPNRHAAFDTGSAWMSLAIEATHQGLHSHAMAGFDSARAYTELGVSEEEYEAMAAVAVGYRGSPEDLPEALQAREAPSGRNPQSSFVANSQGSSA